ncbi:MAG: hypothetical protein KDD69_04820 [Bdellovibrionales bacterium]|nr:hypothetical protein [Bdellovibrionales bacterium]
MKPITLSEGIVVAVVSTVVAAPLSMALWLVFGSAYIYLSVFCLAVGYHAYLLRRAGRKAGKAVVGLCALAVLGAATLFGSLGEAVIVGVAFIWIIRSVFYQRSVISSLADLFLCGLSIGAGAWGFAVSSSVLVAVWCFFLVQAAVALVPTELGRRRSGETFGTADEALRFDRAYGAAQVALRELV